MAIDQSKLVNGIWRNPYMRVFSLGLDERVMELSTYPRAYQDTARHVYEKDEAFVVTENEYNGLDVQGNPVFRSSKSEELKLGAIAYHYAGDPLPGAFPMWLESASLPEPSYKASKHAFPILKDVLVGGDLDSVTILEAEIYRDGNWLAVPSDRWKGFANQIRSGELSFSKLQGESSRQLIRVRYLRKVRARL